MNSFKNILPIAFIALCLASCVVGKKKYDDVYLKKTLAELERDECNNALEKAQNKIDSLEKVLSDLSDENKNLKDDSTAKGIEYRRVLNNYNNLNNTYNELIKTHEYIKSASAAEMDKLSKNLAKREKEINELQSSLIAREERVQELERILAEKDKATQELKNRISNALLGFNSKDLTVTVKDGKIYVSVSEQLLFKSGKTDVGPKGIEALQKLSGVLRDQKGITIMVEGHTDDVPIAKGTECLNDNWDLSVLRATSITRILTSNGVNPRNIVPAGKGEFMPIDVTKTPEGRSKNRRTEIILIPDLDELYKIIGK